MALLQQNKTSSLLGGTRYGANLGENADANLARGKARITSNTARTALSTVSNRNALPGALEAKKGGKEGGILPKPRMAKSVATSSLQSNVNKENPAKSVISKKSSEVQEAAPAKVEKAKVAPSSPAPMDISAGSSSAAFSHQLLPANVNDIDEADHDNPQLVSCYVNDIYEYMRELEQRYSIEPKFLEGQEITGRMRSILVDWLVQVHLRFHLLQETLYLTISIIDRFLQLQEVARNKLQLVGVTSMLIASKYEEMYAPEIADFVYITDKAYTKQEIRKMESIILKTLDFQLGKPLPLHFLRRNSKAGEVDANKHTLAKYLMELTIVDYEMAHVHPSQIAAGSLCLAMKLTDNLPWTETLSYYSKYNEKELMPVIRKIAQLVTKAGTGKTTAVETKYRSSKFMRISTLPELKSQLIKDLVDGKQ